jgi:hypothetical protein
MALALRTKSKKLVIHLLKGETCENCFNRGWSGDYSKCPDREKLGYQPISEDGYCERFIRGIDEDEEVNDDEAGEG